MMAKSGSNSHRKNILTAQTSSSSSSSLWWWYRRRPSLLLLWGCVIISIPSSPVCFGFRPGLSVSYRKRQRATTTRIVCPHLAASPKGDKGFQNDDPEENILARRIEQIQAKEENEKEAVSQALKDRIQEVQASEQLMDDLLAVDKQVRIAKLPVLAMDALLPQQRLEGRTEDPTFSCFLRDIGLGGCFVMVSLDPNRRKMRRHGVVAKIVAVDALKANTKTDDTGLPSPPDPMTSIPTAVDFEILGISPCRILGPSTGMTKRMGRWRRGYDPDGEEVLLGWGDERFVDAPSDMVHPSFEFEDSKAVVKNMTSGDCTMWNDLDILINVDMLLENDSRKVDKATVEKVTDLFKLVDEWVSLATNTHTYHNFNVTATARIRPNEPGLWVEPHKLLARVSKQLGPRPLVTQPNQFCLWAAAIINPLPPLGVSLEIRGRLLEAPTIEKRLQVIELGLRRSIDNLKGIRPLI